MSDELSKAVSAASEREEVRAAILELYADVQKQIDIRQPVCVMSGKCCRFEEYGHRLFVTTMELGTFFTDALSTSVQPVACPGGCPFQVGKMCGVHAIRPFGC